MTINIILRAVIAKIISVIEHFFRILQFYILEIPNKNKYYLLIIYILNVLLFMSSITVLYI